MHLRIQLRVGDGQPLLRGALEDDGLLDQVVHHLLGQLQLLGHLRREAVLVHLGVVVVIRAIPALVAVEGDGSPSTVATESCGTPALPAPKTTTEVTTNAAMTTSRPTWSVLRYSRITLII